MLPNQWGIVIKDSDEVTVRGNIVGGSKASGIQFQGAGKNNLVQGNYVGVSPQGTDRKSTRLNSSHQIISYAVFCLKKKTVHLLFRILPEPLPRSDALLEHVSSGRDPKVDAVRGTVARQPASQDVQCQRRRSYIDHP